MNFCSHCGSNDLKLTIPEGDLRSRVVCQQCQTIHYRNPKLIVGCLTIYRQQVLLCKRSIEPRVGYWNIPCGYMENGETLLQGAKREVQEEALARVSIINIHALYSLPHINQVYAIFLASLDHGEFGVGEESSDVQLFKKSEIPWDQLAFSSTTFALERYFADEESGKRQTHTGSYEKSI